MFKVYQQSIKALTANPVRTILTTLGIVIGIATVIMVLSAGAGFRSLIDDQLSSWGTDTLFIETSVVRISIFRSAKDCIGPNNIPI